MSEFDEWYISDDAPKQPSLPDAYGAGQQSQQAKIDCMQVRLNSANERALSILNHKNVMVDKMQAEIDKFKKLRSLDEMAINQLAQANQVWQIKCDELQGRIDDHDLKLELFINELEKTYREDKDNKIDYWRGFSECADSSIKIFHRDVGFINLKGK